MVPAQAQVHFESSVSALCSWIMTIAEPGDHGAASTGTHGMGVSTPWAAAVAAATPGFTWVVQRPNGAMLMFGWYAMTDAAGFSLASVALAGSTASADGAVPALHWSVAP
jgi:hypothetical protein